MAKRKTTEKEPDTESIDGKHTQQYYIIIVLDINLGYSPKYNTCMPKVTITFYSLAWINRGIIPLYKNLLLEHYILAQRSQAN